MTLNIELLETSFALVSDRGAEFTNKFYSTLLTDYPEVQPLFKHTDMESQGKHLFDSLVFVVKSLRDSEALSKALKGLGTRHVKYGVLPEHYPMVGGALLHTFETTLSTAWTPEIRQAWTEAYGAVTQLMLEGADYSPQILNLP
jgi:hemoglobin-like flavoprotein